MQGEGWGSISPKTEFCEGSLDHPLTFSSGVCITDGILGLKPNLLNQNPSNWAQESTFFYKDFDDTDVH